MPDKQIELSVFTKPWPALPLERLGDSVRALGFAGIELPVRPGFQVEPETVRELPRAARTLEACGVHIYSIAAPTDEATLGACAEAGIPTVRVMARIADGERYLEAEARLRREYDALVPLLERYGVQLGIQNHCGRFVANALALRRLVEPYDPRHIAIVWDAAHEALNGSDLDLALDVVWSHLCMVNLKNAIWERASGPDAGYTTWRVAWTRGRDGLASWPRVASELKARGYQGVVCLTAEYSDHSAVDRLIAEDVAFASSLLL